MLWPYTIERRNKILYKSVWYVRHSVTVEIRTLSNILPSRSIQMAGAVVSNRPKFARIRSRCDSTIVQRVYAKFSENVSHSLWSNTRAIPSVISNDPSIAERALVCGVCVAVSSLLNANVFTSQVYICWLPTESKYLFRFDLAVELLTFTGLRNHFVLNRFLMLFESQWFSMLTHSRFRNGFFGACTFVRSKGQTGRQTDRDRELQLWVRAIFINPAIWRNLSRSVFLSLSILYLFARIPFRSAFNIF